MACHAGGRIVDLSDCSDSDMGDHTPSVFEDADLFAIDKTATKYLNYTNEYVMGWKGAEAFRETYQNWYGTLLTLKVFWLR